MEALETYRGLTVADVMLPQPKTLPSSATVGDVRSMLTNRSVQMVLLADGTRFRGAITHIPSDATDDDEALRYADQRPESLSPDTPALTAFEVTSSRPHRRAVVLGEEDELVGLVCLNEAKTRFCGRAT